MKIQIKKGNLAEVKTDLLVVNIFEGVKVTHAATAAVDQVLGGLINKTIKEEKFDGALGAMLLFRPIGVPAKKVLLIGLGKRENFSEETVRQVAAVSMNAAKQLSAKHVVSVLHGAGYGNLPAKICGKAMAEGTILAAYEFKKYKSEKKTNSQLETFLIVSNVEAHVREAEKGVALGEIYANATVQARELVNEPASHMRPIDLVNAAKIVAAGSKGQIKIKIFNRAALARLGAGGILSVARGSDHEPFMVHMIYKPTGAKKKIALVGKGITFDSGGISLKPSNAMVTMKSDMSGAAAVIGAFSALKSLKPKIEIHGIFAACENMPSGKALVPGDIVHTMSKKTIEVLDTDAEGRVTLADTLFYAAKLKPAMIIDLATLTYACVVSLGEELAGVMSNKPDLAQKILLAAKEAGEKMWELPLEDNYKFLIKSEVADVKNIGGRYGGTLTAGLFLQEFVGEIPWAHIDIAGPAYAERPLNAYTRLGGTGFGVRTILEIIKE